LHVNTIPKTTLVEKEIKEGLVRLFAGIEPGMVSLRLTIRNQISN
jgi:hypothetical protein